MMGRFLRPLQNWRHSPLWPQLNARKTKAARRTEELVRVRAAMRPPHHLFAAVVRQFGRSVRRAKRTVHFCRAYNKPADR